MRGNEKSVERKTIKYADKTNCTYELVKVICIDNRPLYHVSNLEKSMISLISKVIITLFLFLYMSKISLAQEQQREEVEGRKNSLQADFSLFSNALQADYPSLYRYSSAPVMKNLLDSCYNSLHNTTTDLEFYGMMKFLLSAVRDGHMGCTPPTSLQKYLHESATYFPLRLYFVNDKAFVVGAADKSIPAGAEIVSINHQPVAALQHELFRYIVSDGFINSKKRHILGNYFYFYYYLVKGAHASFDIKYKSATGATSTVKLNAVHEKDIPPAISVINTEKLLDLTITKDKIAILSIRTFDEDEMAQVGLVFHTFLYNSFQRIKDDKIKKLIIDLRGNGGGKDQYGSMLYSYLTNKTFGYYRNLIGSNADKYRKTGNGSYEFDQDWHSNLKTQQPASINYTDALWILTDGLSFSATAEFCSIARSLNRAVFVGEETGGTFGGNTSGEEKELVLPTTGMKIQFGMWQYNMLVTSNHNLSRGIMPHQEVLLSVNDLLQKHDSQLEHTLRLARNQKK